MTQRTRSHFILLALYGLFFIILGRLFYWQVVRSDGLQAVAQDQYQRRIKIEGSRGRILTADNHILVGNKPVYRLFLEPKLTESSATEIVRKIMPDLQATLPALNEATESAILKEDAEQLESQLIERIESRPDASWIGLLGQIPETTKLKLELLKIPGLGFEQFEIRSYPEASMAAQLTGFVGKDADGNNLGYFGIEGALEKELQSRSLIQHIEDSLLGFVFGQSADTAPTNGRDVILTIRRDIQFAVENKLAKSLEQYGAKSGEIIVLEPSTGKILAAASLPSYDQQKFYEYEQFLYKNPLVADVFEPGSTFKVLTMAAGIESGAITPETKCDQCEGPRQLGKYSIKTWNNEYHPDITMTEALAKSDNIAMVFAAEKMGAETLESYIKQFRIGERVTTDLQEDTDTPFPSKWGPVETATISFGQGISTNSLQMARAVSTIANQGIMMQPYLVEKVIDPSTGNEIVVKPRELNRVVSAKTAEEVTAMMVEAALHGEAQWVASQTHTVAGKTGTAQIAFEGRYDPNKTVASFIGFAPAQNPKFVMMVKLVEPQSSIWAAETAAPLWYNVAKELYLLLNIPPDK